MKNLEASLRLLPWLVLHACTPGPAGVPPAATSVPVASTVPTVASASAIASATPPVIAPLRVRPPADPAMIARRSDGKMLATWRYGDANELRLWDLEQGHAGDVVPEVKDLGLRMVLWSPDGRALARVGGFSFSVWNLARHTEWKPAEGMALEHASWSPDARRLMVGADYGDVALFDPIAGRLVRKAQLHDPNAGVAMEFFWSPDSAAVAIVQVSGTLDLWDAKTGATRKTMAMSLGQVDTGVQWSPNGALLAASNAGGVEIFDGRTGASRKVLRAGPATNDASGPVAVTWSPDGSRLAATPRGGVEIWDVTTGKLAGSLRLDGGGVTSEIVWSPDGSLVAFGGREGSWLWDGKGGSMTHVIGRCGAVAFSPDGARLTCIAVDGDAQTLEIHDGKTGARLLPRGSGQATGAVLVRESLGGYARVFRTSDELALGFRSVTVNGRSLPIAYTDDGRFAGDRDAAKAILVRTGANGHDEDVPEAEVLAHERKSLIADFVAGRPIP